VGWSSAWLRGSRGPRAEEQDRPIDPYGNLTPAESYKKGCGGCHLSERTVLRKIPRKPYAERRLWIEAFIAQHPCECDPVKPKIIEYLLEKTRR
jgi:hypothetical protein